jgi:tetratricopeptide (TPR) repeat protein
MSATADPLDLARRAIAAGEHQAALDALRHADDSGPLRARVFALKLHCLDHTSTGALVEAYRSFVLFWNRNDIDFHLGLAQEFSELRNFPAALEAMQRVVVLRPGDPATRLAYASLLDAAGRHREAIAEVDIFLSSQPRHPGANMLRASALHAIGQPGAAAAGLRRHLEETGSTDGGAWVRLALLESELRAYTDAEESFRRAAELAPHDPSLWDHWCELATEREDTAQVERCIAAIESAAPHDWRCLAARAALAELRGEPLRGWELMNGAVGIAADSGPEQRQAAARRAVLFAARNSLRCYADECERWVLALGLFDAATLGALRQLRAIPVAEAREFSVTVRGEIHNGHRRTPYRRALLVYARDTAQAVQLAIAFEERDGAINPVAECVAEAGDGSDCFAGPCWVEPGRTLIRPL